jgi:hypothetical protein
MSRMLAIRLYVKVFTTARSGVPYNPSGLWRPFQSSVALMMCTRPVRRSAFRVHALGCTPTPPPEYLSKSLFQKTPYKLSRHEVVDYPDTGIKGSGQAERLICNARHTSDRCACFMKDCSSGLMRSWHRENTDMCAELE